MLAVILFILVLVLILNNLKLARKKSQYQAKYPSSYICLDGHKVRSLSELLIDDFFHRHGINHEYEDIILKSVNSQEKQLKYDWYLPDVEVYVEFFGYSGNRYKKNTEEKINFYRKHNLTMIALKPEHLANLQESIPEIFKEYWSDINHKKHCPNCGNELDQRI